MKQEGFDPYWNFIKQLLTSTGTVLKKGDQETKKVKKKIIAITQMLLAMSQYGDEELSRCLFGGTVCSRRMPWALKRNTRPTTQLPPASREPSCRMRLVALGRATG